MTASRGVARYGAVQLPCNLVEKNSLVLHVPFILKKVLLGAVVNMLAQAFQRI